MHSKSKSVLPALSAKVIFTAAIILSGCTRSTALSGLTALEIGGFPRSSTQSGGLSGPSIPPPTGFVFSPYKDITVNMNWNTNVISSAVTGSIQPIVNAMPSQLKTLTWAFATGECGNENWGGLNATNVANANVQAMVAAGKKYIISTGGAAGSFTCGSDSGFATFINRYYSANMIGIDFDIEAGQTQADINNLIQRILTAQKSYPNLRFSFTLATLASTDSQNLGTIGVTVMNSIKSAGLKNYIIDLMVMDYGSPSPGVCVVSNGRCDMGQSAIRAAVTLNSYWGVPYNQIELTPMIGGNDTQDEVFTLTDADTVAAFALQNQLAGIHFWSFDRDLDCAAGYASPTCNSYGQAGTLGFTHRFISDLGQGQ